MILDEAMHYLVENVLKAKIQDEIRESIKLKDSPENQKKNMCCTN